MGRILAVVLGPHGWSKGELISVYKWGSLLVLFFVFTQVLSQFGKTRGVEKTLRTIELNEHCMVVRTTEEIKNSKIKMVTEVVCNKSGTHLLSGISVPNYFMVGEDGVYAIPPEEY